MSKQSNFRNDEKINQVKLSITELAGPVFSSDRVDLGTNGTSGTWCLSPSQVNQEENGRKHGGAGWR